MMGARLQGHISSGLTGLFTGLLQGIHFGMWPACPAMPALAYLLAIPDQYATHHWIGAGGVLTKPCQIKRLLHPVLMSRYIVGICPDGIT